MQRSRALLLCAPLLLSAALLPAAPPAAADPPPTPEVTFSDTFSGDSLSSENWQLTLGTAYPGGPAAFGTGEIQTYTDSPDNVSVHDGSLYITPVRAPDGTWTSARVESVRTDFKPAPGSVMTFAFNAAMPDVPEDQAQGLWPAGWMNSARYRDDRWSWPAGGEFDVMESVSGGQWSNSVLHCGYPAEWGGPCNEPSGINAGSVPLPNAWGSFNDYSFQWDRSATASGGGDQLRWYHNGVLTQTVQQSDLPQDVWANLSDPRGYHILFNEAIDGAYPAAKAALSNSNTASGVPLRINEVSVSYTQGSTPPPATAAPDPSTPTPSVTSAPLPSTPAAPATETPEALQITDVSSSQLTLTWPAVPGATSYEVLRAGIPLQELTTPAPGTTATNTGLLPATSYTYSVRALPQGTTTPEVLIQTP